MVRSLNIAYISILLFASNAFAAFDSGFYPGRYANGESSVIAAVEIKDKGIFNLFVSIQFLRKPEDRKIYKSDEYEQLVDRLLIESRGIALQKILETKELKLSDLAALRNSIETGVRKRIAELKNKHLPGNDVEVVFALTNFFLLEPKID